ncbi:MAG: helix-turn-helix transcriptional regulator [Acidobacteriota bacterium]
MTRITLLEARKKAGLTQEQLAEAAGRDQALISKIERGDHTNPTTETVEQLAKALGIAPSRLRFSTPLPERTVRAKRDRSGRTQRVGS